VAFAAAFGLAFEGEDAAVDAAWVCDGDQVAAPAAAPLAYQTSPAR
jgi:hypothetical protein